MRIFKSSLVAAAATAALTLCAAEAASAATIVTDLGPIGKGITTFGQVLDVGNSANTYDFLFSTSKPFESLSAMQVQNRGAENVQFELDELIGGNYVQIMQSSFQPGAVIPGIGKLLIEPGSYRLETNQIGLPEDLSGSLNGSITLASVPEPASWILMILGVAMVGATLRRRAEGWGLAA